jgi:hypothetical protein
MTDHVASGAPRSAIGRTLAEQIDSYVKANFLDNMAGGKCCEDCNVSTSKGEPFVHDQLYGQPCSVELLMQSADALRACADALAPPEPGWQPISTAPKDGTWIVVVGPIHDSDAPTFRGHPRACVSRWFREEDFRESPAYAPGWCYSAPGYSSTIQPTHWMPLPASQRSDARLLQCDQCGTKASDWDLESAEGVSCPRHYLDDDSCDGTMRLIPAPPRADALDASPSDTGAVVLSAEDARALAFLLARAIHDDAEASDGDRREARKLLAKLGGDTQ